MAKKTRRQSFFFRSSFPISISSAPEARRVGGAELSKWTAKIKKNEEKKVPFFDFRVVERRDEAFHTGGPNPKWRLIIERNKKKRTRKEPNGDERVSPLVEFNVDHLLSLSLSLGDREVPKSRARPRQPRILSKSFPNRRKPVNTRSNPVKPSTTQ